MAKDQGTLIRELPACLSAALLYDATTVHVRPRVRYFKSLFCTS